MSRKRLYAVVCGAGPASHVDRLVALAQEGNWDVQLVATPSGLEFIDVPHLEALTGNRVRSTYRKPGEARSAPADAYLVAPATFNTVNKLSAGVSDTYALGLLAEAIGLRLPIVVIPFVNSGLGARRPFLRSITTLRSEGVRFILDEDGNAPHAPGTGDAIQDSFPWKSGLDSLVSMMGGE